MRILDRYIVRQLLPIWVWCLVLFIFLSCLVDLFGHLDEILRYRVSAHTVLRYYQHFTPLIFVQASPLALLLSASFLTTRLIRHHELLAMTASGASALRISLPFLFVGWLATVLVFTVNDRVVPQATAEHQRLREEAFRDETRIPPKENVALIDHENRIYHARTLDVDAKEIHYLTILEQDAQNRPTRSIFAKRAIWTRHGWLLLEGLISRVDARGRFLGMPLPFVERLIDYPVTVQAFAEPQAQPETMSVAQLQRLIRRLKASGIQNVRRYRVELAAKMTMPLMNVLVVLIGFAGVLQSQVRGRMRGLGTGLVWGVGYYLLVGTFHGLTKQWPLPIIIGVWSPHLLAGWWCLHRLRHI